MHAACVQTSRGSALAMYCASGAIRKRTLMTRYARATQCGALSPHHTRVSHAGAVMNNDHRKVVEDLAVTFIYTQIPSSVRLF